VRSELTRERLIALIRELARAAPKGPYRVYLVGGSTAVYAGWRPSSIDADLFSDKPAVFHDIQGIKERLDVNVEFERPERFVPALEGSEDRHVFVDEFGPIRLYHYDPYAQIGQDRPRIRARSRRLATSSPAGWWMWMLRSLVRDSVVGVCKVPADLAGRRSRGGGRLPR
jgi:hypothetical protein